MQTCFLCIQQGASYALPPVATSQFYPALSDSSKMTATPSGVYLQFRKSSSSKLPVDACVEHDKLLVRAGCEDDGLEPVLDQQQIPIT